jgi:hypothetical protein
MKFNRNLKIGTFILLISALGYALWLFLLNPLRLTRLYGEELAEVIQNFREVEFALETRLQPETILLVATENYVPQFQRVNQVEMCDNCDRFWVVDTAEVKRIRVISYSSTQTRVRAEVITWGHTVNSRTLEPINLNQGYGSDTTTYIFVKEAQAGQWMLDDKVNFRSPNLMNPSEITLDDFILIELD